MKEGKKVMYKATVYHNANWIYKLECRSVEELIYFLTLWLHTSPAARHLPLEIKMEVKGE